MDESPQTKAYYRNLSSSYCAYPLVMNHNYHKVTVAQTFTLLTGSGEQTSTPSFAAQSGGICKNVCCCSLFFFKPKIKVMDISISNVRPLFCFFSVLCCK